MSGRPIIPAWEIPMLKAIADGPDQDARRDALFQYVKERDRRRRHARVRDARDRERRTLVGAHVSRAKADVIAWIAAQEGVSVTAFVNRAIRQAVEQSDTFRAARGGIALDGTP